MAPGFAYLSGNRIHCKLGDAPMCSLESHYARQARDRAAHIHERNAWKATGTGARFMSGGLLWGRGGQQAVALRARITGVCRGSVPGELIYALDTSDVGGVFVLSDAGTQEQRLFHTADYRVSDVSLRGDRQMIACTVRYREGISNIAIMQSDGSNLTEVSQGDAIDQCPRWVPGSKTEIVFQSAGIGRNSEGLAMAQAAFSIHRVDIERGEIVVVAEDPTSDLLAPQFAPDGNLYYIRRPYHGRTQPMAPLQIAKDFVFLPFRLLYALFQYLNFFSAAYTGKTLTSSGGAQQRAADVREMMIWGNLINADKSARNAADGAAGLVPDSWQLVRQDVAGKTEVLAKGVLSFDLSGDGSVLYSNGNAIFKLDQRGNSHRLHKDSLIEQVIACD